MSNKKKQQLFLLRHGQTAWSLSGQHTGVTDLPLLKEGEEQARRLAPFLIGHSFVHVWSSPMQRALQTCQLSGLGAQVEIRQELKEWNYGRYEGKTTVEIHQENPTWNLFLEGAPEGEDGEAIAKRVDPLIKEVKAIEGDVALYAHGHVLRAIAARWLELPAAYGRFLALDAGSVSILSWEHERDPVIKLWNFHP